MFLRTFAAGPHVRAKFPHLRQVPTFAAGSQVWAPRFCRRFPRNRRCPRLPQVTTFIPGPTFAKGFPGLAAGSIGSPQVPMAPRDPTSARGYQVCRSFPHLPQVPRFGCRFPGIAVGCQETLQQVAHQTGARAAHAKNRNRGASATLDTIRSGN